MKKLTYEYVKKQIENVEGYKLLSKSYKNNKTKLKIQCDKGHIYYQNYHHFQGNKCPYCANNIKYNYKYVKKQIESVEGYKLLSKSYKNNKTKLKVQCNKGHKYKSSYSNFQQGHMCPICDAEKQSSKAEKEIQEILEELSVNFISNDRTQIINPLTGYNLELDIWIPSLNKAIEFNGKYWHSLEEVKIKDKEKVNQCKEKSIDLLVINEQNWMDNKVNEINKIKNWIKGES